MMDIPFDGNNTDDYVIFLTETLLKDFKLFVSWFCFVFVCFWFLEVTIKVLTILDYRMLRNHVDLQRIHCQRPGT